MTRYPDLMEAVLCKLAEEKKWSTPEKVRNVLGGLLVGGALNRVRTAGHREFFVNKVLASVGESEHVPLGDVAKLRDKMGLNVSIHSPTRTPRFVPDSWLARKRERRIGRPGVHLDAIGGKTSLPVAAHELGHAAGYAKPLGRAIFRSRLGSLASTPAVVSASLGDPDSKLSRLAAPAVALGMVPTLLDEALASKRGLKQLKGMQSPEAYRASRKVLGRAWGTYAATAAGLGLTTEGTRRFRSWYKKHQLRD